MLPLVLYYYSFFYISYKADKSESRTFDIYLKTNRDIRMVQQTIKEISGSSSFGRARPCQGRGGRFEPGLPLIDPSVFRWWIFFTLTPKVFALVVELVDTQDLKSCLQQCGCGFNSRLGHKATK